MDHDIADIDQDPVTGLQTLNTGLDAARILEGTRDMVSERVDMAG